MWRSRPKEGPPGQIFMFVCYCIDIVEVTLSPYCIIMSSVYNCEILYILASHQPEE